MAIETSTIIKAVIAITVFLAVFLAFGRPILDAMERGIALTKGGQSQGDTGSNVPTGVSTQYSKDIPTGNNMPRVPVNTQYFGDLLSSPRTQVLDRIVLHHTGGSTASGAIETLKASGLSVHYMIDKDGTIYYLVDEDREAFHVGCCPPIQNTCCGQQSCFLCVDNSPDANNHNSIGIEIVNTGNAGDYYTDAQYTSLNNLLKDISSRRGIPIDNQHVFAHYQIGFGKWDPSPNFDWTKISLQKPELPPGQTIPASAGYP